MKRTPVFSAETFKDKWSDTHRYPTAQECADIANEVLNKLIANMPVVYGYIPFSEFNWTGIKQWHDTHTARLFDVREIEKEECEDHEPDPYKSRGPSFAWCRHCNKKLEAKWEVCE